MSSSPPPPAGVFTIRHQRSGRTLVGSSPNVQAALQRHKSDLRAHAHRIAQLQKDWNEDGEPGFVFQIVERVDAGVADLASDLATLEALWIEQLGATGEKSYVGRRPGR